MLLSVDDILRSPSIFCRTLDEERADILARFPDQVFSVVSVVEDDGTHLLLQDNPQILATFSDVATQVIDTEYPNISLCNLRELRDGRVQYFINPKDTPLI